MLFLSEYNSLWIIRVRKQHIHIKILKTILEENPKQTTQELSDINTNYIHDNKKLRKQENRLDIWMLLGLNIVLPSARHWRLSFKTGQ